MSSCRATNGKLCRLAQVFAGCVGRAWSWDTYTSRDVRSLGDLVESRRHPNPLLFGLAMRLTPLGRLTLAQHSIGALGPDLVQAAFDEIELAIEVVKAGRRG